MESHREEQQEQVIKKKSNYTSKNSCYETFLYSISTPDTKRRYSKNLKEFLNFCKFEEYEQLLEITDDEKFEAIRDFLISLTGETRKLSYASVNLSYFAIKLFFDVNKVVLNWKNISRYKGKFTRKVEDRLYTKEELKTLLEHADLRERVIVMTLLSTGMRVGGLASIKLEDMQYLEEYKLYKFVVYADDINWKYVTFCTPETAATIQAYLNHREKHGGEELTKKSPLLTQKINASNFIKIGSMDSYLIQQTMTRLQYRSTVTAKETADTATERGRIRKEFMRCHAFRKMFNSTCIENNVNHYVKEMLMGHKKNLGLDVNYFRPQQNQLLQEYLKVIDDLTINDENRLSKQVHELVEKNQDSEYVIKGKLQEKEEQIKVLMSQVEKLNNETNRNRQEFIDIAKQIQEINNRTKIDPETRKRLKNAGEKGRDGMFEFWLQDREQKHQQQQQLLKQVKQMKIQLQQEQQQEQEH
ncbi:MAG: tyrosine-type recombinase/integrase [Nitrososphaeraceae archaeon]